MAPSDPSPWLVWFLVAVLGLGMYGFRVSFIQLHEWIEGLPPRAEASLAYIPPAVLAALILPELIAVQAGAVGAVVNARVLAGLLAIAVGWRTQSMMATIGVGMVTLWTVQFVFG